jgi:DNA-binding transcriptional LysR family regulator
MSIDLRLLRQARALSEHGSVSRAAAALGIAQPTLSRSLKELEAGLGLKLFTRHRFGVEPTDFGHVFLLHADALLAQFADLEREVALVKGLHKGDVGVAFGAYAAEALVPACLRRFSAAHPSVRVCIRLDALETHARALRARAIDLAVGEASVLEREDAIEVIAKLAPVRGFVVVRAGHPLAAAGRVTLADVAVHPFVQIVRLPPRVLKPLLRAWRGNRGESSTPASFPAIECPTVPLGVSAIVESNAVMIASLGSIRRELEDGRVVPILSERWMHSEWAVMRLRGRSLGPAPTAFVDALLRAHDEVLAEEDLLVRHWTAHPSPTGRRPARNVPRPGR